MPHLISSQSVIDSINTHTHPFDCPFAGTTRVIRYQKGKTNLDFTEARDSEWQWHQLEHMQVCISLQTDNHASTPPLSVNTLVSKSKVEYSSSISVDNCQTDQPIDITTISNSVCLSDTSYSTYLASSASLRTKVQGE